VVNSRDVTERVAAEHSLREEEERFRLLVQYAYDAVVTFDLSGTCIYASPATTRVLGYEPQDLIGQQLMDQVHPEDLDRLSAKVTECLQVPNTSVSVEYRSLHADGAWRTVESSFTNLLDEPSVGAIVANLHDVTELRAAQAVLERQAQHDPLTDLPNRNRLMVLAQDVLARAESAGTPVALLFVDLDGFKPINDERGHHVGDIVLETVARRLRYGSRADDVVARVGGDEFCVLCEADRHEARALATRLREHIRTPIDIGGTARSVDTSIGIAMFSKGATLQSLVQAADTALRRAKRSGKGRVEEYDPDLDSGNAQESEITSTRS
jgi:diguanylate cyclase (GGDEF)-like protein/PAS domain S-box-containing protein